MKPNPDSRIERKKEETRKKIISVAMDLFNRQGFGQTTEKPFPGRGRALINAPMTGQGAITSAQHGYRLVEIAEITRGDAGTRRFFNSEPFDPLRKELPDDSPFKKSFRSFLEEYGHRSVYEGDLINPRWREDPSCLLGIIKDTMETANLAKIKLRQKEKADRAWLEIRRRLPLYRRILIKYWLKQSLKGAEIREKAKSVMIKSYESFSVVLRVLGQRLAGRGIIGNQFDIYHCTRSEILSVLNGYWDGKGLAVLVAERKAGRKEMEALSPPDLIIGDVPRFVKPVTGATGSVLTGMGVAAGKASGTARLIYYPHEGVALAQKAGLSPEETNLQNPENLKGRLPSGEKYLLEAGAGI